MRFLTIVLLAAFATTGFAHPGGHGPGDMRAWTRATGGELARAAFLMTRDERVYLERPSGETMAIPLRELSAADRGYVEERLARVRRRNEALAATPTRGVAGLAALCVIGLLGGLLLRAKGTETRRAIAAACLLLGGACGIAARPASGGPRPAIAAAFDKYSPRVATRWDDRYLYVESDGMPDHPMMIGIRSWQQQVPLPQPYRGGNAWSIPLRPALAEHPISAKTALYRGAIALAVNGVPIFNALNNRGEDALQAGELDQWGGHCGRADDYHYHAAPLHLQQKVGPAQPIGFALDGYPLYGLDEPDGKPVRPLDEFNGHADPADRYHYHATKTYPYINGGLRGVVSVRDDEIDPQAHAAPVRPYLQPLRGAVITDFQATGERQWRLTYQRQGKPGEVAYSLREDGKAEFRFTDGNGNRATEQYARQGEGRRGPPRRPPNDGPPPPPPNDDRGGPRRPWILVHAPELDANRDGIVTHAELLAEVDATFAAFDRNADGKLSAAEYGDARGIRRPLAGFVSQHAREIDANGDAFLTKGELLATVERMFDRADRNHDGKLTADELAAER